MEEGNRVHRGEDSHEEVEEDSQDHREEDTRQVEEGFLGLRMNAERLNYHPPSG